jgi:hypothetical protein
MSSESSAPMWRNVLATSAAVGAFGLHESTAPKHHWSGWYAAYIVARQRGRTPEDAAADAAHHMEDLAVA